MPATKSDVPSAVIRTDYWRKPGPSDQFDWSATYDDYEGGDGYDEPAGPVGYGATEQAAVADLKTNHPRCRERGGALDTNGDCLKCGAALAEICRE